MKLTAAIAIDNRVDIRPRIGNGLKGGYNPGTLKPINDMRRASKMSTPRATSRHTRIVTALGRWELGNELTLLRRFLLVA